MREKFLHISNFLLILLLTYVSCIIQITSFFPKDFAITQVLPAPMLWLPPMIYLCLYRKPLEGIIHIYTLLYAISYLSIASTGALVFTTLVVFSFGQILKIRFFWPGARYFMLIVAICVPLFHVIHSLLHFAFEGFRPALSDLALWLLQGLITPLFAFVQFHLLEFIDHITDKEPLTEASQEAIA